MPNFTTELEQRAAVIAEAKAWIGTPFAQNAALKGIGVDCGRFLSEVYGACGFPVPQDIAHWPKDWMMHVSDERYLSIIEQFATRVESPQTGDAVIFRMGRVFSHGGIIVSWPSEMIHARWRTGVEIGDPSKSPFERRQKLFFSPWAGDREAASSLHGVSLP